MLVHSGMGVYKALALNFASALAAVAGTVLVSELKAPYKHGAGERVRTAAYALACVTGGRLLLAVHGNSMMEGHEPLC